MTPAKRPAMEPQMQRYLRDCAVLVPPGRLGADDGARFKIDSSTWLDASHTLTYVTVIGQYRTGLLTSGPLLQQRRKRTAFCGFMPVRSAS